MKTQALFNYLKGEGNELTIEEITQNGDCYEWSGEEYLVYTDSEADDAWDEYMDDYIDDCIIDRIDEALQCYFDRESFKRDCLYDGRGHSLAGYDGCENEETIEGETFYIYRTN